jgi:hypothetical protein
MKNSESIALGLHNYECIEWQIASACEHAGKLPFWRYALRPLGFTTSAFLLSVILVIVGKSNNSAPMSLERDMYLVVIVLVLFPLAAYFWGKAIGTLVTALVTWFKALKSCPRELYVFTNHRLIIVSNRRLDTPCGKDSIRKIYFTSYRLLGFERLPNGRTQDLKLKLSLISNWNSEGLIFEYLHLHALEQGDLVEKIVMERFGLAKWPCV